MTQVVYPAIDSKSKAKASKLNAKALTTKVAAEEIPPGAWVMVVDKLKTSKMEPHYLGPYKVVRRNLGGAYVLRESDHKTFKVSPDRLKVVLRKEEDPSTRESRFNAERILAHEGEEPSNCKYLVKWLDRDESCGSWIPEHLIDAKDLIATYWDESRRRSETLNPPVVKFRLDPDTGASKESNLPSLDVKSPSTSTQQGSRKGPGRPRGSKNKKSYSRTSDHHSGSTTSVPRLVLKLQAPKPSISD